MIFRWDRGRQDSGYEKMKLIGASFIPFDLYIIRYKVGNSIPEHLDPVDEKYNHHRLNIIIKQSKKGGQLSIDGKKVKRRVVLFRPDIQKHSVTKIEEGSRYIISIGWVTRK